MKKIINTYIYGIGIGGIIYSLSLLFSDVNSQTISNIVSCLFISGFMGLASLIYDIEKLPFLYKSLIHLISISSLVYLMNIYNGWLNPNQYLGFFIQFLIIYLIICHRFLSQL
ncbi:DUF3021 family protein [Streptococcus parauberis]|nr:DUF3021 family protein [Streptococcus parauberis]